MTNIVETSLKETRERYLIVSFKTQLKETTIVFKQKLCSIFFENVNYDFGAFKHH